MRQVTALSLSGCMLAFRLLRQLVGRDFLPCKCVYGVGLVKHTASRAVECLRSEHVGSQDQVLDALDKYLADNKLERLLVVTVAVIVNT